MNLELFANEKYIILKLLDANQITIKQESYVSLSQQEIADLAHFSKQKTNKIINELIDNGIILSQMRGRYSITDIGIKVLKTFNEFNCPD